MHMNHVFKDTFREVASAFVLKYNGSNKFCSTTICHVEQIDADKFAFVRRLENIMSSQPLYERIVVDRAAMELSGYTFEKKTDESYSEHFVYSQQADKSVSYNFYMFRDPGLKRILRYRMFNWGIDSLQKIIIKQQMAADKLRQKKQEIKEKATEKLGKAKQKLEQVKGGFGAKKTQEATKADHVEK